MYSMYSRIMQIREFELTMDIFGRSNWNMDVKNMREYNEYNISLESIDQRI